MRYFKLSAASAAAALVLMSTSARASDGTITFNGNLQTTTCAVTAASASLTVGLPTLAASTFTALKPSAGQTNFSIAVSGCPTGAGAPTSFTTFFEAGPTVNLANGYLKNTGTATGVELRLLNASNSAVIDLSKPAGSQNVAAASLPAGTGAGQANFWVEYYGTSATAGSVTSNITYSVIYN